MSIEKNCHNAAEREEIPKGAEIYPVNPYSKPDPVSTGVGKAREAFPQYQ